MKGYTISELVDLPTIQKLADGHYQSTGMPVGIIDAIDGSVLVATGWQDICTSFHRAHPSSLRYCQESDKYIKGHLIDGEACQYRCKNGLWDIGVPVIVAKRHLATIFLGQFFYEEERADRDYFIRQAQQYGYNLSEYLAALDRVPVFTKEKVDGIIAYNKSFSRFMAELAERSLSNFEAQQALRDSEYKFRVLTETSPSAIFLYQEEKIVYANPATAKMLGFAKEELLETRLRDWLPSELKDRVRQSDGSGPSPFECKFTTKSGEERWGYISIGRTEYQGNPASIMIIHDITKKKEAEEALQKESDLLRCIIDSASDLIYIKDRDGVYLRCNRASEKFIGLSESEQIGKTDFDFFDREKAEVIQQLDRQVLAAGKALRIEEWVTDRDGGRILFDTLKAPYYGPNGEVIGLVGISRDITERKRAEEDLRESEALLNATQRLAKIGGWDWDVEHQTTFWTEEAFRIHGFEPQPFVPGSSEYVERSLACYDPDDRPVVLAAFQRCVQQGEPYDLEFPFTSADGCRKWIRTTATAVREDGRIVKVIGSIMDITDLKRAEEKLLELSQMLQLVLDNMPAFVFWKDRNSVYLGCNRLFAANAGLSSAAKIVGLTDLDLPWKHDEAESYRTDDRSVMGTGVPKLNYEETQHTADGRVTWVRTSKIPLKDLAGNVIGVMGTFEDITERKQADQVLRLNAERMEALLQLNQMTGATLEEITSFAFEAAVKVTRSKLGYLAFMNEDETVMTMQLWSRDALAECKVPGVPGIPRIYPVETTGLWGEAVRQRRPIITNDYAAANPWKKGTPEGHPHLTRHMNLPVIAGGKIVLVAGVGNKEEDYNEGDVNQLTLLMEGMWRLIERKRAEEEIRRLKNYLGNIIDSMPSILVGMDCDEIVTQWNRQTERISGISATEAVGRPIAELLPDFSPWIAAMRSGIDRQRPASMEKLLIEKDGERRFYDLMLYPIITNGVEGAVLRIEDATERARVQELMIQTEKMLSVGGMAAGMAHEINNPLGIITQAAQNIERRVSPGLPANRKAAEELGVSLEGMKAYFEKRQIPAFIGSIREASLRASRIIANMLQFSRFAGTTMQSVSPAGIVEQALELAASDYDLKKKFDFRSIEIIRDYAPDMPEVPMVVIEMEQVMLNLLKNAAQALTLNPPGRTPRITLRLRREERYALVEVEDNGPGMPEDVRRRVFEPFFTTKEPGMGTGLGLSVSYMIVTQNHKGLMEVESKAGTGTCFRVRLPLSNPG
jgi:PAS domain S-box-containing protein